MFRVTADFNTETQTDEIIIRKHIISMHNKIKWIRKECSPYQLPDGTLIPVHWEYPEYLEVTLTLDSPSEPK